MRLDPEIQFPDVPFDLEPSLVLLCRRGSEAHGTYIKPEDPSGIDDRDLMGIVVPPFGWLTGIRKEKRSPWTHAEAIKGVWDIVLYDVRKFVGMLSAQNPSCLSALWCEPEDYLHRSGIGKVLVEQRDLFRARTPAFNAFHGYAQEQMRKMTSGAHQGYMGAKRKALVEKYGYDTKNAAHRVRLLHMGLEYQRTGRLNVRRTWDRDALIEIKRGKWTLDEINSYSTKVMAELEEAHANSALPEAIDEDRIESMLEYWIADHIRAAWHREDWEEDTR